MKNIRIDEKISLKIEENINQAIKQIIEPNDEKIYLKADSGISTNSDESNFPKTNLSKPEKFNTEDIFARMLGKEQDVKLSRKISNNHRLHILKGDIRKELDLEYSYENVLKNLTNERSEGSELFPYKINQVIIYK